MKKLSVLLSALALALAVALPASATQYIVATGLNKYNTSYVGSGNFLNGCVPDAKNVFTNAILRGDWNGNGTNNLLLNAQGTFANVSNKLMNLANTAVSGDVVLYYHSSHGYQNSGKNTGICMYDKDMDDSNFAKILANFKAGVKVVIMLDTCHSGGMFKSVRSDGSTRTFGLSGMDFAARVNEELAAIRADEAARGIKASAKLAILDCGWVTAADYNQYSWDGDEGGAFTECYIGSCKSGDCDKSPYGNGDGYATMYEMFKYAVAQDATHGDGNPNSEDYTMPQCTNTTVLSAVTYGWVGKEEPTGIRFAAIPEQSATVGSPLAYTLVASNTDGSDAANITISIKSSTAPSSTYSLNNKNFSFTPTADGTFTFNFVATNTVNHTGGKATMTVNAALAAPVALAATGVGQTSFTANWQSIAGASSYFLSVAQEASTAARTTDVPDGDPDYLADFSSISGSGSSDLKDENLPGSGWEYVKAFSDSGCIKIGSSKAAGSLATPAISVSGNAVAVFDIASYSGDNASVVVSVMHSGDSDWTDLETLTPAESHAPIAVEIPADSGTVQLKLESASASKCRFYVYSIALYDGAGSSVFSGDVGDVLAYTVNGLENNTTYTYKLRAIGNAPGPWSDSVTVRTVDDPTAPPTLFAISDKLAELGDTVQFDIGYASAAAAGTVTFTLTDPSGLASVQDGVFSFTPAAPGVFSFTLVASNSNGDSAPVSFTVTVDIPAPATDPATSVGSDSFVANWQAVVGASSYLLTVYQGQVTPTPPVGETVTDTFTADGLGLSGSYAEYTGITDQSTAVYAIKAMKNSGAIQFNSKNNIGLVSTTSGGAPAKITVSWNSTTAADRALDVYASATPYASAADLYDANDQGTLVGSLSYDDGDTELEISGTYAYIGLRSRSGAIYLDHIRIDWVSGAAKAAARDDVVIFSQDIGNVTHYTVTGLAPETSYTYTVAAIANGVTGAVSQATTVTTSAGPAAPAWSSIPAQTAIVDKPFSLDLASYVTGSPTPTLSLTAGSATLNGSVLSFTPAAETSYSFTVLASNDSGTASATFSVNAIVHSETKYAVCVGINEYEMISSLEGCVNDSFYFYNSLVDRGGWLPENMVRLNDSKATKNGIRTAISNAAARAVAGDVFIYQHSSHGGNKDTSDVPTGKDVYLCVYDEDYYNSSTAYNDYELAADLAKFASGVRVVVVVDACFSGGLFKSKAAARAAAADFDLAGRVTAIMDADRIARRARGEDVSRSLSSSEIGWVTAANYNETSLDGGFYHSDAWLTDPEYGDEYWDDADETYYFPASYKQGGVFLASATWGWWNGDADKKSGAGDNDGFCDGYEFWQAGYDFASQCGTFWGDSDYNFTPQHTNDTVLRSVKLGAAGFEEVDAPTALAATDVTGSSFVANWSSVSNAVSYILEVSAVADSKASARGGSADFALVSDSSEVLSGEYVILSAGNDVAMNSTCSGASSGYLGCTDVTVVDDVVSTDDASLVWTLEGDADSCTLYSAAAGKFANPATSKSVGWSDTAAGSWTVSSSSDGMIVANNADSSWKLQYNVSSPRFACYSSAQRKLRLFRATGSGVILSTNVGNVTSFTVTGLEPGTYAYRVKAVAATASSDFSNTQNVTLYTGPAAPSWSSIPVQDAIAGELFSLDLAPFVSGSPAPTLSVSSGAATLTGSVLSFTPATAGNTDVIILATNESGNATATVSVAVGLAAPEALAASSVGSASFVANWSAVTGATAYDLVVIEGQGDTPGPGPGPGGEPVLVEDFSGVTTSNSTAISSFDNVMQTAGWTGSKVYPNNGMVKLASSSAAGSIVSPAVAVDGSVTVIWSAQSWPKDATHVLVGVSEDGGSTYTEEDVALTESMAAYTNTFAVSGSSVKIRWQSKTASKQRFYLDDISVYSGAAPSTFARAAGDVVFSNSVGNVTSYTVNGLSSLTEYSYVVRATAGSIVSEWSDAAETKTTDGPAAPAWSEIPAQAATVGELFSLDLAAYVSGSPSPVLSASAGSINGTVFSITPAADGPLAITLTASNEIGTAQATLSIDVSLAPLEAPEVLPATSVGSASFVANWSAVAGATSYDLVVTEGKGDTPGPGPGDAVLTETFANVSGSNGTAVDASQFDNEGWTLTKVLYKNDGEVQIGSGSYAGDLTSPAVEIASGAATVVFSAKAYSATENKFNLTDGADDSREITLSTDYAVYTQTFENVSSTFSVSFVGQAAKKRFYLNGVTIYDGAAPTAFARAEGDIAFSNSVGNVTSYTVNGLSALTEYSYVVRACRGSEVSEWSDAAETKTTDGPAAPAWSEIPAQTAYVDELFSLDLAAFVSGSPAPVLSLTAGNASLSGTVLSFTPASAGDYPVTVLASNEVGTASVSFTVSAVVHTVSKYALDVGINEYETINSLYGCVNDANYFRQSLIDRGGWRAENMTILTDDQATKAAIRAAISDYASRAVPGDTFIYQHSSHGGNTDTVNEPPTSTDVYLCVYDENLDDDSTAYNDYELAADLAQFASGVKVVVFADACFSGGLFRSRDVAPSFDLAGRVTALMNADRAARKARGEDVSRSIDPSEIGWITAARFDETSQDGGFYHIDLWLDDPTYAHQYFPEDETEDPEFPEDFRPGAVFTASASWAWWHGTADTDNDGSCDVYEFWQAGYDFCSQFGPFQGGDESDSFYPQCTNIDVLKSVELGAIGIEETSESVALPASNVTDSSFTANWTAVSNAVAYYLRIAIDEEFDIGGPETYIEEGFETISPEGWTISNANGEYHSSPYIGTLLEGKYSLKFSATGQYAITPEFDPSATMLQFWAYGNGADGSTFTVSAKVDGVWEELGDAKIAKGGSTYEAELPEGTTQVRFDFTKVVNCALDDVIVFTERPSTVLFEDLVTGTSFTIDDEVLAEVDKAYYYIVPVAASGATGGQSEVIEVTLGDGPVPPPAEPIKTASCSFHDFGEDSFFCQVELDTDLPAGTEIGIWVATDLIEADWVQQSVVALPADGILDVEIDFDPTATKTCFISFGQPLLPTEP